MFLVTHIIVFFYLFPIGTIRILLNPKNGRVIKKEITTVLFTIIGQHPKLTGLDNINPEKNYLIVSNYPGSYAGFILMNIFPDAIMLVHSFLARAPVVGFLLKSTGAVFVQQKRYGATKRTIDETLEQVRNRSIIILPEGGRTPDGAIREFRRGFIYILRHSATDLLPVTLKGFYSLKPLKRPYLDPDADLEVVIHKPIDRSMIDNLNSEELRRLTVETIKTAYRP
jgi:1-acyl-sn-glycerol-3-phosphate acyltransferase